MLETEITTAGDGHADTKHLAGTEMAVKVDGAREQVVEPLRGQREIVHEAPFVSWSGTTARGLPYRRRP